MNVEYTSTLFYKTLPLIAGFLSIFIYVSVVAARKKLDNIKGGDAALAMLDGATIVGGLKVSFLCLFDPTFFPEKDIDLIYPFIGGVIAALVSFLDLRQKFKDIPKLQ